MKVKQGGEVIAEKEGGTLFLSWFAGYLIGLGAKKIHLDNQGAGDFQKL